MNRSLFEERKSNSIDDSKIIDKRFIYHYIFDIKYEILNSIIKDIQMISQLIKFIKNYQISDLIFITGNSTSSVGSRFYFNYRNMIDFYLIVLSFEEKDNLFTIKYHVYKTKPICVNFVFILSLYKLEKQSKLEIEIIPPDGIIISEKYLNIIYNELDYNFLYLSLAIKLKKENLIYYNSDIIKNEFFVLSQIVQNIKLIGYLVNGKLINITNSKKDNNDFKKEENNKYIHLDEFYKIYSSKQKSETKLNDLSFKIIKFKSKEDKLTITIKIIFNDKDKEINNSEINSLYNIISVCISKITKDTTYLLIKCAIDSDYQNNKESIIKNLKKIFGRIIKLSEISKNNISF